MLRRGLSGFRLYRLLIDCDTVCGESAGFADYRKTGIAIRLASKPPDRAADRIDAPILGVVALAEADSSNVLGHIYYERVLLFLW